MPNIFFAENSLNKLADRTGLFFTKEFARKVLVPAFRFGIFAGPSWPPEALAVHLLKVVGHMEQARIVEEGSIVIVTRLGKAVCPVQASE